MEGVRGVFLRRRAVWWPTPLLWAILAALVIGLPALWWFKGEAFLGSTHRRGNDVLVVEGWIGPPGINAAAAEARADHYRYVVTAGGLTGDTWSARRWSYALMGRELLLRAGLPPGQVMAALPENTETHRTYAAALAVRRLLEAQGLKHVSIDIFTEGPHARRSRLTYAKVMRGVGPVGMISWWPPGSRQIRWWHSSDRAEEFLKESVGYFLEFFLNSGRGPTLH